MSLEAVTAEWNDLNKEFSALEVSKSAQLFSMELNGANKILFISN